MTDYERLLSGIRLNQLDVVQSSILTNPHVVHAVDDRLGLSAVFHAVLVQNLEILRLLLSHGSSPNATNLLGDTALHQAADDSALAVATELIQFGADVNAQNQSGESPLHNAVYRSDLAMTDLLLLNGANPNLQSATSGQTPLHLAISEHSEEIVAALLSCQASLDIADSSGRTARSLAKTEGLEPLLAETTKNLESKQTEVTHNSIIVRSFTDEPPSYLQALGECVQECLELLSPQEVQLFEVLQELGLDTCFDNFARLGYSSAPLLLELLQSDPSVGLSVLEDFSVGLLGTRFAILVKLEQVLGRIPFVSIKYNLRKQQGMSVTLCGYPLVPSTYVSTIPLWLDELGLPQYAPRFAQAGFTSLELLYLQMHSSVPVTSDLLSLMGIENRSHQALLLTKLFEDTQLFIGVREDNIATCGCLLL